MHKRFISLLLIIMLVTVIVGGSVSSAMAATATIHLNKKSVTINEGMTQTIKLLTAKNKTIGASKVKWVSDNKKIASVSAKGVITAVAPGKTVIKATYKGKTYKCNVTVRDVKLGTTKKTLYEGDTFTVRIKAGTTTVAASKATWKSSDESVATVSKGKITAIGKGTAKITVKYGKKTYTCNVTVKEVKMTVSDTEYYVGKTVKAALKAGSDVIPAEKITWISSDETVATVSAEGEISLLDSGIAEITAKYGDKIYKKVLRVTRLDVLKNVLKEKPVNHFGDYDIYYEIDIRGYTEYRGLVLTINTHNLDFKVMDFKRTGPEESVACWFSTTVSPVKQTMGFRYREDRMLLPYIDISKSSDIDCATLTKDIWISLYDLDSLYSIELVADSYLDSACIPRVMECIEKFLQEEAGLTLKDIGFYEYVV